MWPLLLAQSLASLPVLSNQQWPGTLFPGWELHIKYWWWEERGFTSYFFFSKLYATGHRRIGGTMKTTLERSSWFLTCRLFLSDWALVEFSGKITDVGDVVMCCNNNSIIIINNNNINDNISHVKAFLFAAILTCDCSLEFDAVSF